MSVPAPLTPGDCDLQDFPFMPLHVARLRDSDFALTEEPEACWYAVLLWSTSWHQIPAASLPDDDRVLARMVGLGRDQKTWRKHRGGALRGFIKCDDGRLYHPVTAEVALSSWLKKLEQRYRTECARRRKAAQRTKNEYVAPTFIAWLSSTGHAEMIAHVPRTDADCHEDTPPVSHGTTPVCPKDEPPMSQGKAVQERLKGDLREGNILVDDDDETRARARAIVAVPDPPTDAFDVADLAAEACRAGGVRHSDPGHIARHVEIIREWQASGADPPLILATIRTVVADATEPIHSLKFFAPHIRQAVAKLEGNRNGDAPTALQRNGGRVGHFRDDHQAALAADLEEVGRRRRNAAAAVGA